MISGISFTKMVASGNDFIIIDQRKHASIRKPKLLSLRICNRKYGIGADGLLILEKSKSADIRMRIFNPDGSEPNMCGNGIRCVAVYVGRSKIVIETKAGIVAAKAIKDKVKIRMTEPKDIRLDLPIKIGERKIKVNFIDTGVPHAVIFVEWLNNIDVVNIGRQIRFHKRFLPDGVNVDFVQIIDDDNIKIRTYERGVEAETLACGTGTVAAALLSTCHSPTSNIRRVNAHTKGGEILKIEFDKANGKFRDVWLEGKARTVYSGVYYV